MEEIFRNISFCIIYIGVISIITFIMIKSKINLFQFSIPMMIFWSVMFFAYLGYPAIVFKWIPYYVNLGRTNDIILWKMFLISSLVWIQLFIGIVLGINLFSKRKFYKIEKKNPRRVSFFWWGVFFVISLFVLFIYLNRVSNIAFLEALKGASSRELAIHRSNMTNNFSDYHRYSLFMKDIIPFLSLIAFSQVLLTKKLLWKFVFSISFIVAIFIMVMDIQKAPVIWYILTLVAVYLVYYNKPMSFKLIFKILLMTFILLFVMYVVFMGSNLEFDTILNPIQRAMTGQIIPFYTYLELVPDQINFQYGKTFPNPRGILPFEHFRYTVELRNFLYGKGEVVGSLPTAFFGELWVNFGWKFIILTPILFGMILAFIHSLFLIKRLSSVEIALIVWLAFDFRKLVFTGFSRYFLPLNQIVILFICFILYYWEDIKWQIKY